jgi:tetratricopeptide (TPR) repeat protein
MATPPLKQVLKDADAKVASGDFLEAISLYERTLDGSAGSADVHYKIALLYDDKMNDPLNALHHFKRYLTLAPTGARAAEVKEFMKRDELALATALSGDSVVSRSEAARLKNENLNLRKQLDERAAQLKAAMTAEKSGARATKAEKSSSPSKRHRRGRRSDVVRSE